MSVRAARAVGVVLLLAAAGLGLWLAPDTGVDGVTILVVLLGVAGVWLATTDQRACRARDASWGTPTRCGFLDGHDGPHAGFDPDGAPHVWR